MTSACPATTLVIRPPGKDAKDQAAAARPRPRTSTSTRSRSAAQKLDKAFVAQVPESDERDVVVHEPKPDKEPKAEGTRGRARSRTRPTAGTAARTRAAARAEATVAASRSRARGRGGAARQPRRSARGRPRRPPRQLLERLPRRQLRLGRHQPDHHPLHEHRRRTTRAPAWRDKISGTLDGAGITSMLERLTGKSSPTGARVGEPGLTAAPEPGVAAAVAERTFGIGPYFQATHPLQRRGIRPQRQRQTRREAGAQSQGPRSRGSPVTEGGSANEVPPLPGGGCSSRRRGSGGPGHFRCEAGR